MRHTPDRLAGSAAPDLACARRWVQLPMVPLTALFTALAFKVFDVWSGLPLMLAVQAPMLVAMASVWPGRTLPRSRAFALTVTAHVVAVLVGGLAVGQGPATTLPIATGSLAYAIALALAYRRHHDTWSPRDARSAVAFFGYAFALAPIGLLLGAYAGCPPTALLRPHPRTGRVRPGGRGHLPDDRDRRGALLRAAGRQSSRRQAADAPAHRGDRGRAPAAGSGPEFPRRLGGRHRPARVCADHDPALDGGGHPGDDRRQRVLHVPLVRPRRLHVVPAQAVRRPADGVHPHGRLRRQRRAGLQ